MSLRKSCKYGAFFCKDAGDGHKFAKLLVVAVLFTVIGGTVGCGGDEDTPTPLPVATPKPAPTAAPAPTTAPPSVPTVAPTPTPTVTLAPTATPRPLLPKEIVRETLEVTRGIYGGHLRTATYTRVFNWDMTQNSPSSHLVFLQKMYNGILQLSPQDMQTIVPDLAESWSVSPDGSTYTIKFRQGITWHDGTPFTADDAVFSYERWIEPPPGIAQPRAGGLNKRNVKSIRKIDDLTMQIIINDPPNPRFVGELAFGWHILLPKHVLELPGGINSPERIIGTGPYVIDAAASIKDVMTTATRNPHYFKTSESIFDPSRTSGDRLPYLDRVTVFPITDTQAADAAFRTQAIDLTGNAASFCCSPKQAESIVNRFGTKVDFTFAPLGPAYIDFNHQKPPFNDLRARKAVHLALDRQRFVDLALDGGAFVIWLI